MQLRSCSVMQARRSASKRTNSHVRGLTVDRHEDEAVVLQRFGRTGKFCCFDPKVCGSGSSEKPNLRSSALIAHLATLAVSFSMSHRYDLT